MWKELKWSLTQRINYRPRRFETQTQYIDWRWPLSCLHSVMMVVLVQLGKGVEWMHALPLSLYLPPWLHNSYPTPSTPSSAKLVRECYLYSPILPLSPSLWGLKKVRDNPEAMFERYSAWRGGWWGDDNKSTVSSGRCILPNTEWWLQQKDCRKKRIVSVMEQW